MNWINLIVFLYITCGKLEYLKHSCDATLQFLAKLFCTSFAHVMGMVFTVRNEVAKVMFLHLSVHREGEYRYPPDQVHPPRHQVPPQDQVTPGTRYTPRPGTPPGTRYPPPRRLLLQMVHILLECILVCC